MRTKRLIVILLIFNLTIPFIFNSCSNKADNNEHKSPKSKKIELRIVWWGSQTRADATKKALNLYQKKHSNIKFQTEFSDFKGYWDKIATFAASNSLPDIIQQDNGYLTQYVKKGTLQDLQPYINKEIFHANDIAKNILKLGMIDGKNYGICLGINSQCLIYNPDLYAKANVEPPKEGMSWQEYFVNAKKMYDKTKTQVSLPFHNDPKLLIEYWVRSAGKSLYNRNGTALGFKDYKLLASLFTEIKRLIKTGAIYDPIKGQLEIAIEESGFVKEKDASFFSWSNFVIPTTLAIKKDLQMVSLPQTPAGKNAAMYIKPSMFFSVAQTSSHKSEAIKVIDFFTNDLEANKILKADRGVPISSKVRADLKALVDESTKQTFDYIDNSQKYMGKEIPPAPAGDQEIFQLALNLTNEIIADKKTPNEAAKEFMQNASTILNTNN